MVVSLIGISGLIAGGVDALYALPAALSATTERRILPPPELPFDAYSPSDFAPI
jgi:hypothetical protein